ncbi:MAG TPA: retropepsin-like aspartic protease [Candidatus Acidoferrales bacterium]|nr:retropepsin-like aspartic protease [Candidatus Acidoferrales bacterium]
MHVVGISLVLGAIATAAEPQWLVDLPLTMEKNLPLVQITVNHGKPLTFILDSAAGGCVIDSERAQAIGLEPSATAMSSGSGGLQPGEIITGLVLNLGGLEIQPARCFTFSMKSLTFRSAVDGILGMPLFRNYVVEIDYPGSHLRIFKPDSFQPAPSAEIFPLRMRIGPIVRGSIRVRGRTSIDADFQLDTGSAHILTLCTAFVDRLNLLESADGLTKGSTLGLGGAAADMVGRIEEVRLGRFAMDRPTVRLSRQTTGTLSSEEHYAANLGGEFLRRYKVTLDVPGLRLFLEQ